MAHLDYALRRTNAVGTKPLLREDEFELDFDNPRLFIVTRWNLATGSYRLKEADRALIQDVHDHVTWNTQLRKLLTDAKASKDPSKLSCIHSIAQLYRVLWNFENYIKEIEPDLQDIEDVDTSSLWAMTYLNVKLSLDSPEKLKKTSGWMNELRRQIQLLNQAVEQAGDDQRSMRIEMCEIFDPILALLHESIDYLQRHWTDDDFVKHWLPRMQSKIKDYLSAMEATVRHLRAMGTTRTVNQLQASRSAEVGIRNRGMPMDGSEKAVFPVQSLPAQRTHYFTGRVKEINKIHEWLGTPGPNRLRTYLIYGRRGIGKTSIALEYANRNIKHYDAIFWIQCETSASLRQSFADVATSLELDGADRNGHFEENLMKVLTWLKNTEKRWLLIYDNAEREQLLKGYWPAGARGSILLTSRSFYNFFEDDQRHGETVPVFDPEESRISLMAQLGKDWQQKHLNPSNMLYPVEEAAVTTLLEKTGGLPLAIHHASRLIRDPNIGLQAEDESIRGFMELFSRNHASLPPRQLGERDPLIHSLDTIWAIAFNALSTESRAILSVLALISPDVILIDLFQPSDQDRLTPHLAFCKSDGEASIAEAGASILTVMKPSRRLEAAIAELVAQGMIHRTGRQLTIHREVQEAVNYRNSDDLKDAFDAVTNLLYDAFPQQKQGRPLSEDWSSCRCWVQHIIKLASQYHLYTAGRPKDNRPLTGMLSADIFVRLLANCSWYLFEIADYEECLNLVSIARDACVDKESITYAHLLNTAGVTNYDLNRLDRSREALETCREIREKLLGPKHPETAIVLANLGNVETAVGQFDTALVLLSQSAFIREQLGDEAAVMLALNYLQIGRVHFLQGAYPLAYSYYQRCEGVLMKKVGRNRWYQADLHYAYGNLEMAQSDFVTAAQSYERARRVCMDHNPLHPLTAAVYHKLACAEFEQDHYSKAFWFLDKAISVAELRSAGTIDGMMARILWKQAEIMLEEPAGGRREEGQILKTDMEFRQREIAEELGVDLRGYENDEDRERSFDLLVAGYYR